MQNKKRQLAAILFTDIAGYTALMQKDEQTASVLLRRFQNNVEELIPKNNGQIINFYGDGALCIFNNPLEAVQCAMQLQTIFSETPKVPTRIGLHMGTVVFENEKIYGDSVNLASRIESMGVPGAVLFSKKIRDEIKNQPDIKINSIGKFAFKNVEEEMELFAVANEEFIVPKREEMKGKLKSPDSDKGSGFFQKIWNKRIPQILMVYILIAWLGVQLFDWALGQFGISPHWAQIFFITAVGIIPSLLMYLDNRERIHKNKFTKKEKILFPTNLIALGAMLFFMFRTADLGATSKNIIFINADGIEETQNVVKEEFRKHIRIYPFDQITEDSSQAWIGYGIPNCLKFDMEQNKYIDIHDSSNPNRSTTDKIKDAKIYNVDFYVDGTYQVTDEGYEITPMVRNSKNGNIVNERRFTGNNLFTLIDSLSLHLLKEFGLSSAQIEESIDLDFAEYTTNNLESLKQAILSFKNGRVALEKAVELDSTYAGINLFLAGINHINSNKLEAKTNIDQAMRHRKKLPFRFQITTIVYHHLIYEEFEKAEKLLKIQLEITPNDVELNGLLSNVYWQTKQIDKLIEHAEKLFSQNPKPSTGFLAMQAALMKGNPDKVIRITKGFLLLDQQNTNVLTLLALAYVHKGDYETARETIEKIILIDPESETTMSHQLKAVNYMEANEDALSSLSKYEGTYRNTYESQMADNLIISNQIYNKAINQIGKFMYPAGENILVMANPGYAHRKKFLTNEKGEIYATLNTNIRRSGNEDYFTWLQDSIIWNAEELLEKKEYQKATVAYDLAIEKHPEHFYLQQAKRHLEFVTSISKEELLKINQRHVGEFGKVSLEMKNNQLVMKQEGAGRKILLPISDHQFISLQGYAYIFEFEEKNGEVDAFQEYQYDHELKIWKKAKNWYFKKNKLLN